MTGGEGVSTGEGAMKGGEKAAQKSHSVLSLTVGLKCVYLKLSSNEFIYVKGVSVLNVKFSSILENIMRILK